MANLETENPRDEWRKHPGMRGPAGMLLAAHDKFRQVTDRLVEESNSDHPNWAAVAALFSRLDQALQGHHHAEEQGMFPRLAGAGIEIDTLVDDHEQLFSALDDVRASFDGATEDTQKAIESFAAVLRSHLEAEENTAVPYLLEHPWF